MGGQCPVLSEFNPFITIRFTMPRGGSNRNTLQQTSEGTVHACARHEFKEKADGDFVFVDR